MHAIVIYFVCSWFLNITGGHQCNWCPHWCPYSYCMGIKFMFSQNIIGKNSAWIIIKVFRWSLLSSAPCITFKNSANKELNSHPLGLLQTLFNRYTTYTRVHWRYGDMLIVWSQYIDHSLGKIFLRYLKTRLNRQCQFQILRELAQHYSKNYNFSIARYSKVKFTKEMFHFFRCFELILIPPLWWVFSPSGENMVNI